MFIVYLLSILTTLCASASAIDFLSRDRPGGGFTPVFFVQLVFCLVVGLTFFFFLIYLVMRAVEKRKKARQSEP